MQQAGELDRRRTHMHRHVAAVKRRPQRRARLCTCGLVGRRGRRGGAHLAEAEAELGLRHERLEGEVAQLEHLEGGQSGNQGRVISKEALLARRGDDQGACASHGTYIYSTSALSLPTLHASHPRALS